MHHVVVPLDDDHVRALRELRCRATGQHGPAGGHITIVSFQGLDEADAVVALRDAVGLVPAFVVRAHGYGMFVSSPGVVALHVPVVRHRLLDALHDAVSASVRDAGGLLAPWTADATWSPHITIADDLPAAAAAIAVDRLARRHHPTWHVPVSGVRVLCELARAEHDPDGDVALAG